MNRTIYFKKIISRISGLLGLLDRNPSSDTYGCFDRDYWHYTVIDFACARKQEAVLTLALLYGLKYKSNPYYNNAKILNWVNAALKFWAKIQCKDGSFNEWYPNEHSFVATAFSSYAISETLLLLKDKIKHKEKIIPCLKKAADWLLNKNEKRVLNQESGAAIALLNIYLLTKNKKYKYAAEKKIIFMLKNQNSEGWWSEYGGPDIGYLSLTIDYLAKYYKKTKDKNILKALEKAVEFTGYFIHPNLSSGGEYASRNTEYLIPHGLEILAKKNKAAAAIAEHMRESLKSDSAVFPLSIDDRYLSYIAYTWLQAFIDAKPLAKTTPKYKQNFVKYFSKSNIYINSNPCFYLIVNFNKGGSFKLFFKKTNKLICDSGIFVQTKKDKLISGYLSKNNKIKIHKNKLYVEGAMAKIPSKNLLNPMKNTALRAFQCSFGKSNRISYLFKNKLRDTLITKTKKTNVIFKREMRITNTGIKIIDIVKNLKKIKKIMAGEKCSYIYTPSSRYFHISDLANKPTYLINPRIVKKIIKIHRIYNN